MTTNADTIKLLEAVAAVEADPAAYGNGGFIAATLRMIPALPADASDADHEERDRACYYRDAVLYRCYGIPA